MALDDKYDIKKLIDAGKEKGYLTYNEVNDLIPNEIHSPDDLDDLLTTIGTQGIDLLEGSKLPSTALDKRFEGELEGEEGEEVELDQRRVHSKKQMIPFACTCAKWAPFHCLLAKAKLKSQSALSADN